MNIGLYHPQLMNRIAISHLINEKLDNRVVSVDHLYDLFSASYMIAILVEPEILSLDYNSYLVSTFLDHVSKPVIIVPYYERNSKTSMQNAIFVSPNPTQEELIDCILRTEEQLLHHYSRAI